MGSADVRSFSRNKRGIAGSLIWVNFDRHALLDLVCKLKGQFVANVDDIRPQYRTDQNAFLSHNAIYASALVRDSGQVASATVDQFSGIPQSAVSGYKEEASPWCRGNVHSNHKKLICTGCLLARSVAEPAICCRPGRSEMPCQPRLTGLPATSRPGPGFPWFRLTGQIAGSAASRGQQAFAVFCNLLPFSKI